MNTEPDPKLSRVCEAIAEGDSVTKACKAVKVSPRVFFRALAKESDGPIGQLYARARAHRAEARSDRIDDIVRRTLLPRTDREWIEANAARVAIDALKWLMARENQSRYGDRVIVENPTPAKQLTREEAILQLKNSGLSVADVFGTLTTVAEPLPIEASPADEPPPDEDTPAPHHVHPA